MIRMYSQIESIEMPILSDVLQVGFDDAFCK